MGKQHRRTPDSSITRAIPEMEMAIKREDLQPGDCISMDQYVCKTPGRLPNTYGKEHSSNKYNGGTVFVDHASGYVYVHNQVSLRVGETLQGKHSFENFGDQYGIKFKSYHADNQPFNSAEFLEDLELQNQTITFSGVGAHHANGVAERTLKTVTTWARTMLMHMLIHWPEEFRQDLWPFAMNHAAHTWNILPKTRNGLTPYELFTGCKVPNHEAVRRLRVWGCPVYVLDPSLQDGHKIPKWTKRSRLGIYVGISPKHSSTVGFVLSLDTGYVSPQYHVVYDEHFSTVFGHLTEDVFNADEWKQLLSLDSIERHSDSNSSEGVPPGLLDSYDEFLSPTHHPIPSLASVPEGDDEALTSDTESETDDSQPLFSGTDSNDQMTTQKGSQVIWEQDADADLLPANDPLPEPMDQQPQDKSGSQIIWVEQADPLDTANPTQLEEPVAPLPVKRPRGRPKGSKNKPKAKPREYGVNEGVLTRKQTRPRGTRNQNPTYAATYKGHKQRQQQKFAMHVQERYLACGNPNTKIRAGTLETQFLQGLNWTPDHHNITLQPSKLIMFQMLKHYNYDERTLEQWHPMALAAKANDADTPTWNEAMNGPYAEGFWEACHKEIDTLVDMGVWEVVDKEDWMSIIPTTWAFRVKRLPSGLIRKLKARFCVRGDQEIENVHYWETYAPVVSWTTVRLLPILSSQLDLATRQVDYTAAFVHADVETPPNYEQMTEQEQYRCSQFASMPRGFSEPGKVLRLKKNLYGKKAAPRLWFNHLKVRLQACGFEQKLDVDPCLFISDKVICLVYVDDTLLYAKSMDDIDEVIRKLTQDHQMTLEVEDDVAGFLGVHIEKDPQTGNIILTQKGLIDKILESLRIDDLPPVHTPANQTLGKDLDGDPADCTFNYASVIGALWYLYGHSRPDLGFACSQAARFTFQPKRSHELALIRIGQYLKKTRDKGLILKPMVLDSFTMDAYVDSDYLGTYGTEPRSDPDNVKSRGGHVILVNGCPIIWQSKLIDAICLSTMMAEYYALSIAMREVLPLRQLVKTVARGLGIDETVVTNFKTTVWEDNVGCLTLANLDPGQSTSRSRHFDSKVHWFRSHLSPQRGDESALDPNDEQEQQTSDDSASRIEVLKIATELQLADLFTKPLTREVFERLREMLMGW
jgi:hypothetical protein